MPYSKTKRFSRTQSLKPFCKLCKAAGKKAQVYTSHWVKDRQGNVTCPTLLSQECRYCHKAGHTPKYCPVLNKHRAQKHHCKKKTVAPVIQNKMLNKEVVVKLARKEFTQLLTTAAGKYGALAESDDEEADDDEADMSPSTSDCEDAHAALLDAAEEDAHDAAMGRGHWGTKCLGRCLERDSDAISDNVVGFPKKNSTSWADYSSDEDDEEYEGRSYACGFDASGIPQFD